MQPKRTLFRNVPGGARANDEVRRPGGTNENSPAFQRWGRRSGGISPVGTAERLLSRNHGSAVPTGLFESTAQPGVETPGYCRLSLRDKPLNGIELEVHAWMWLNRKVISLCT